MTAFNLNHFRVYFPFFKNLQSTFYYGTIAPSRHMCQPYSQYTLLDKDDEEKVQQFSLLKVYHLFSTNADQSFLFASITLKNQYLHRLMVNSVFSLNSYILEIFFLTANMVETSIW